MDIKGLINRYFIKSKRKVLNLIILFLCGVLLILIGDISTSFTSNKASNKANATLVTTNVSSNIQNSIISNTY